LATVTGQGTTYNLPNFHGELFNLTPTETPFLSAIGGIAGAKTTRSKVFEWQTVDRRDSTPNRVALEGALAPEPTARSRRNVTNVVEIHQSTIEVSYTKQAATGEYSGANVGPDDNPITDEVAEQVNAELEAMALDIEKSFLSGVYANPANNSAPRKTRGILTAITTNVDDNGGTPRPITKYLIDNTLLRMFDAGAKMPSESTVLMLGPAQKVKLSNVYASATLSQPTESRNVGGVAIDTLVTDFGVFGVMVNRHMPDDQIAIIDLSVCHPVFLEIPGKGLLFVESLGKVGSYDGMQLYGEVGLEYGPEHYHALIKDLAQ
jgi:hypothetical protein